MKNDLECPYCGADLEVCHDDGFGYEESTSHEMECSECEKNFVFYTSIIFRYSPKKADCLNGEPHRFGDWRYLWDHSGVTREQRRCVDCSQVEQRSRLTAEVL